jgi:hypothetical protein
MMHNGRGVAGCGFLAASVLLVAGCGEPMGIGEPSTFTAEVSGARTERIAGTATAGADPWMRQFADQITLSSGHAFSVIALLGDGKTISFTRPGTELPAGTHKLGMFGIGAGIPKSGFSAGYSVRVANGLQLFMADSGSITITDSGSRLTGSFVLYASQYQVIPFPTRDQVGKPITPLETGTAALTISGTFDAARRSASAR